MRNALARLPEYAYLSSLRPCVNEADNRMWFDAGGQLSIDDAGVS